MKPNTHRLAALDLVRFLAAVLVAVFHYNLNQRTAIAVAAPITFNFNVGVQIFFVISGFVIAYSASGMTATEFAWRRFLRLFPIALICATITASIFVNVLPISDLIERWARAAFFPLWGPYIDNVYWTLGVEICFYAFVAVVVAVRPQYLECALMVVGITVSLLWLVPPAFGDSAPFGAFLDRNAELLLITSGQFFILGAMLYYCLTKGPSAARVIVAEICFVVGLISLARDGEIFSLKTALWTSAVVVIVAGVYFDNAVSPLIGGKVTKTVGLATYPFYLLHLNVGVPIILSFQHAGLAKWKAQIVGGTMIFALSVFIVLLIEPILRGWIERAASSVKNLGSAVARETA